MKPISLRAVIAGGGTGGHVIPAIAVAEEIRKRGGDARFVGTRDRMEARLVPEAGFGIDFIDARPLTGGGVTRLVSGLVKAPIAVARSVFLLGSIRPNAVLGVGGYVSGPVVLAARIRGVPSAVLEQNAAVGLTNRLLSRIVNRAFVSYEETLAAFPAGRAELTGNPVKKSLLRAVERRASDDNGSRTRILVMGGSQGASSINERVPAAISMAGLAGDVTVLHQCGEGREREVAAEYKRRGIEAEVVPFIVDTAGAYSASDFAVTRAGATTISELSAVGLPAVLLPYPHHSDRQQERNAEPMKRAGAAIVLDERVTGVKEMSKAIARFAKDPRFRATAAEASTALGRPDAAERIVDWLERLAAGAS